MPESDASGSVGTPLEQSEGVTRQQDPYRHPNLVKKPKEAPPYPIARLHALLISDLPSRIFAVVRLVERRVNNFFSPDLLSGSLWTSSEVFVSFIEIAVNRQHAFFGRLVIAIVDYCSGHTAEHRLNNV